MEIKFEFQLAILLSTVALFATARSSSNDREIDQWFCSNGWTLMKNSRKCFRVIYEAEIQEIGEQNSWLGSQDYCSRFGGQLAIIDSPKTQAFLSDLLDSTESEERNRLAWIGLTRLSEITRASASSYRWSMSQQTIDNYRIGFYEAAVPNFSSRTTFHLRWADGEPSFGVDKCVALAGYSTPSANYDETWLAGELFDVPCSNRQQRASYPSNIYANFALCEVRASSTDDSSTSASDVEGDLVLPYNNSSVDSLSHDAVSTGSNQWIPRGYWEGGKVVYEISTGFLSTNRSQILSNFKEIEENSDWCVEFVERTKNESDFLFVQPVSTEGCYSTSVGRTGGQQNISLGPTCFDSTDQPAHILHELLHVLGLPHEHQRFDRDEYIAVLTDNISMKARSQFVKIDEPNLPGWAGFSYDFESIMHYSWDAMSRSQGRPTILPKNSTNKIFLETIKRQLSTTDKFKLKRMYCEQQNSSTTPSTTIKSSAPTAALSLIPAPYITDQQCPLYIPGDRVIDNCVTDADCMKANRGLYCCKYGNKQGIGNYYCRGEYGTNGDNANFTWKAQCAGERPEVFTSCKTGFDCLRAAAGTFCCSDYATSSGYCGGYVSNFTRYSIAPGKAHYSPRCEVTIPPHRPADNCRSDNDCIRMNRGLYCCYYQGAAGNSYCRGNFGTNGDDVSDPNVGQCPAREQPKLDAVFGCQSGLDCVYAGRGTACCVNDNGTGTSTSYCRGPNFDVTLNKLYSDILPDKVSLAFRNPID